MTSQIIRFAFFDVWFANAKESRSDALLHYVLRELGDPSISDEILNKLEVRIRSYCQKIDEKWAKSGRHRERFLKANALWLQEYFSFTDVLDVNERDI